MGSNTKNSKNVDGQPNSEDETDFEMDNMAKVLIGLIRQGLVEAPNEKKAQLTQKFREILWEATEKIEREISIPNWIPQEILVQPSPAAQNVVENEVIIRLLFKHLDSSSLLSSRLVCKMWEYSATRQLLTRCHENVFKIKFMWHRRTKKYRHRNKKNLEDFYETCGKFIQDSTSGAGASSSSSNKARQFLCGQTKFTFADGDLSSTVPHFFQELGVFVRFLSLKPSEKDQTEGFKLTLRSILLELTPNLQYLSFKSSGRHGVKMLEKNPENLDSDSGLLKLKVLKLSYFGKQTNDLMKRVLVEQMGGLQQLRGLARDLHFPPDESSNPLNTQTRKIMEFAPNLESILDHQLIHTPQIVAAGKFHLVKSLDLTFPPDHPNLIVKFAAAGPKLSKLNLIKKERAVPTRREVRALNSILESTQFTLVDFGGVENLKHVNGIQLPVFPLVEKLRLAQSAKISADGRILPSGFDLALVFPNLVSLHFDHLQYRSDNPFNSAACGNALCGLNHLEFGVQSHFDPLWLEKISSLYSNLSSLRVNIKISDGFSLFPTICKSIWSCLTQLAKLHFTLDADCESSCHGNGAEEDSEEDDEENMTNEMDSIFTGFPLHLCRKLNEENLQVTASAEWREFPSILDMKKLTELKISCVKIHPEKLWSHVTEIHGFEQMKQQQNLRVEVTQRI